MLIYLATPYSSPNKATRIRRFHTACEMAARLFAEGFMVYSPIAHTHPIADMYDLPPTFDFWEEYDKTMMDKCDIVVVVIIDGWNRSKGVTAECQYAKETGKDILYMNIGAFFNKNFGLLDGARRKIDKECE